MNPRIVYWSITSALAGFLFGFDTVVISGVEQTIQKLWGLSAGMHGLAMGAALYGTVLGALLGGWPADKFGRKPTLLFIGGLYVLSAIGCAFANGVGMLIIARAIGGIGIGISTVAAPLYISEIAPPAYRGRLAGMFQFNIVFGIVIAFLSNAILAKVGGEQAWRWMLGIAAIPSVIYAMLCFGIPESPRWLLSRKGDRAAGLKVLKLIEPDLPTAQLEAHADGLMLAAKAENSAASSFWTRRLRVPIHIIRVCRRANGGCGKLTNGNMVGMTVDARGVKGSNHLRPHPPQMAHEHVDDRGRIGLIQITIHVVEERRFP